MSKIYFGALIITGLIPLFVSTTDNNTFGQKVSFPTHWEGKKLKELPLSPKENRFTHDFPGKISRFSNGKQEIIFRVIFKPTRKLHPASDCFRGSGYSISNQPIFIDNRKFSWNSFVAEKNGEKLFIRENIQSLSGKGQWPDVSTWFWNVWFAQNSGPWMAVTVAESLEI